MINSNTPTQSTNKTQKKKNIFSNYGLKILQHNHSLFFQSYNHSSLSFHIFLSLSSLSDLLSLSDRRGLKIDINSMDWRSTVIAWWFGDRQQRRGGLERWRRWILFLSFWFSLSLTPILSLKLDVGFSFALNFCCGYWC